MKILITTDWYKPVINGVVTSVINLKSELEKAGHEVRVLTLSPDGKQRYEDDTYYLKSFRVKVYPQARATHNFHSVFLPEIFEWHPDIIHSQCEWFSFIFAKYIAIRLNIPIVHTYHTIYEDYAHYLLHGVELTKKLVLSGTNRIVNSTDYVIAPTVKTRNLLLSYGIDNPIFTIPTGINLDKYKPRITEERRSELLKALGIPKNSTVIVSIGRLAYEKNVDELIDLMVPIKESHPDMFLVLVGGGPYEDTLRERVSDLGLDTNIRFTGMVSPDQVPEYFQMGKLFVCASQSEAQGLTYIEALASGIPLLCKYDQCLESVLVEGVNGFSYENPAEFMQKLTYILDSPDEHAELCHNAEITSRKYSKEVFGEKVISVYQEALATFKGHPSIRAHLVPMLKRYR